VQAYKDIPETARNAWEGSDYLKAFELLLPLAEQGNASAQYIIGTIYDLGLGRTEDAPEAVRWYASAANQGHPIACNNLETIYSGGRPGVSQDQNLAARYRRMAEQAGFDFERFMRGSV
jgi:uncharacterized protein